MNSKYTKIAEEFLSDINETAVLYKHNKSGARVITIKSKDPNKVFCIGFKTAPINSTGLTHILEHSVLCGSDKYTVKDPFVELLKSSLNTFLNAFTAPDKTMYPIASLNLKDFKNLMDIYLDAVFHPAIYKHEEIFMQEGWHYEIENKEDPIKINGVVYNEMKGAFSNSDDVLFREIMHSLYPDTCYGFESGGDPKYIPDLTYEQFLNFHKTFYSPSNSYIFMYGDLDMDERLEYLDNEYLSKYDYIESPSKILLQQKFENPISISREYPVTEEADLVDKYLVSYNVSIGTSLDIKKVYASQILTNLLFESEGSPVKTRLLEEGICETVECIFEPDIYQPFISIIGKGCKKENIDRFKNGIDSALKDVIKNGIPAEEIESTLNYLEFTTRDANFGTTPKGLVYGMNTFTSFLYDDTKPFEYLKSLKYFDELRQNINTSYFVDIVKNDILNNNHKSFVTLVPSLDCLKKEQEALEEKLALYKKSLTEEEIDKLILKNKALREYQQAPESAEALATMPKLSISDVSENPQKYNLEVIDDKHLFSEYFTNEIIYKKYLFKLEHFSNSELQYIKLFGKALALFDTENHTYRELDTLTKKYTGGITTTLNVVSKDDYYQGYFNVSFSYLRNNASNANELVNDILFNSKFESLTRFKELLSKFKDEIQGGIIGSGHTYAARRLNSYTVESDYYSENISGIRFFDFIKDLLANFDTEGKKALDILKGLAKKVFTLSSYLTHTTSTREDLEFDKEYTIKFESLLEKDYKSDNKFVFKKEILNEGFMAPIDVNFVAAGGASYGNYNGSIKVMNNYLSMAYLWQVVRVKGGAYGCFARVNDNQGITYASYRDPNITETLKAYKELPDWILNLELTDKELEDAKIGAIGLLDDSCHVSLMGMRALTLYLVNAKYEDTKKNRLELINASLDDIKANSKLYKQALDNDAICVIGNKDKIVENKNLFKTIRNLF
ncbi:MAG: insulinase family protein [Acholeplasmatales bacterium]|nr:insulinase family protein [Acholeplasmatales bacterium]